MSLRRKLMMILLLTSVLPMLAVRMVQAISIFRLQSTVATDMRERLTEETEQNMLRTVDGYAKSLDQQAKLGFALLRIQAAEVEHRLAGPKRQERIDIPTVQQFAKYVAQGKQDPWALEKSERHAIMNDQGELEPLTISKDTQVLLRTRKAKPGGEADEDIYRLEGMTDTYQDIHDDAGDTILWHYTSLESGLHFSYPAKAVYNPRYTPSQRAWYRRAIQLNGPINTRPYIDASTRQLVITLAQPVRARGTRFEPGGANERQPSRRRDRRPKAGQPLHPDSPARKPAGVTAIDLRVSRLLDPKALNTKWSDEAQVLVIAAHPAVEQAPAGREGQLSSAEGSAPGGRVSRLFSEDDDADVEKGSLVDPPKGQGQPDRGMKTSPELTPDTTYPPDVYVVADLDQENKKPRRLIEERTVAFDDAADREAVKDDLINKKSGVRRVKIDGEDRMIAYGQIGSDEGRPVFALIIAPAKTIFAPAEAQISKVEKDLRDSLATTGGILLLILIGVGGFAFFLSHRLTRPIVEMAHAARRVASGNLDARVEVTRKDELGQLGKAFNDMVPALRDRLKIRESLAVAMQVQQSLLPDNAPDIPGLDIAGHSEYCDETGGDYYDFIELDQLGPDTLAIAVGDVTGHGIAAALLMATGRALIRSNANNDGSLSEVFSAVNHQLCEGEFTGRFMTLMYLVIHNKPGSNGHKHVQYLSAGHDPVIVHRPSENRCFELPGNDIPLGIDPNWKFSEHSSDELRTGDVLIVGTDGIWECFNPKGEQFGKERLCETVAKAAAGSAEEIAAAISAACRAWRGSREQEDDITMVVVKLEESGAGAES